MSTDINIKKSTFNKIIIVSVAALMISSFFGGYILRGNMEGGNSSSLTNAALLQQLQQQQQQQAPPSQPTAEQEPQAPTEPTRISSVSLDDDPMRGKEDAPVTLVEFSDYQCPFCQRAANETIPQVVTEYVDTGKVKHVFRDYPIEGIHPNAIPASVAAQCANEQGKYWVYHDLLFSKQTEWQGLSGNDTNSKFKQYAADLGLDTANFNSCFDSNKYADEVSKDIQDGTTYGVSGTPTFFIGNDKDGYTLIVGAQPFSTFKTTIDQVLANSSSSDGNGSGEGGTTA